MDEYDMDISEGVENDGVDYEISGPSVLDEMLDISEDVESYDYAALDDFPEIDDVIDDIDEVDDSALDKIEDFYSAVPQREIPSLAEMELERMLSECEENMEEDEDPKEKVLSKVKRWK